MCTLFGVELFWKKRNRIIKSIIILSVLIFSSLLTFAQAPEFITKGDANQITATCYQVTKDELNRFGVIWGTKKLDLSKPFELDFIITLGSRDTGADGIALVFHDDPRGLDAVGEDGGGLGFGKETNGPAIIPSVAVEFDTYNNNANGINLGDVPYDHTQVVYDGNIAFPRLPNPVQINPDNANVEDGQCYNYKITWNPTSQELKLFFGPNQIQRFSHKDDIINKVFNGKTMVYYGFTGSTGGQRNEQTVCIPDPSNSLDAVDDIVNGEPLKPVTIPVLTNDNFSTGVNVGLSRITQSPANGSAVISGSNIIYTANAGFVGTETFTYQICENSSASCYSKCETAIVTVNVACTTIPVTPTITAIGPTTFCGGSAVALRASPGIGYIWSNGANTQEIVVRESGKYWVKVINAAGCPATSAETSVTKIHVDPPTAQNMERCGAGVFNLSAQGGTNGNYKWYTTATGGTAIAGEVNSNYVTPVLQTTTTYYVANIRNGCESVRVPVIATVHSLPKITASSKIAILKGGSAQLAASGGITYTWSPGNFLDNSSIENPKASPEETTVYTVTGTNKEGCIDSAQVIVTVEELGIPTAFSPNGDGKNDTWEIANILNFQNTQLQIFDRWGSKLFESPSYKNDWGGIRNGSLLPAGTYFYVITIDKGKRLVGSVSIIL